MTALASPFTLIERLSGLIAQVRRMVAERQAPEPGQPLPPGPPRPVPHALGRLVAHRLNAVTRRFAALLARFRAGALQPRRIAEPRGTPATPRPARPVPDPTVAVLPRRFGWLTEIAPRSGGIDAGVTLVLEDAEVQAMIAVAPDAVRRVVSPLYWALGAHLPVYLRPAPRPGAKPRALPTTRAWKASVRESRKVLAAYAQFKRDEAAGRLPPPPPLPAVGVTTSGAAAPQPSWRFVNFSFTGR